MFALLIVAGFALFILSAVALFRPIPKIGLKTRKIAAVALMLGLGSCVAGIAMAPPPDPEAEERRAAERAEREAQRALERMPQVAGADPNIQGVTLVGNRLSVQVHYETAWDGKGYFDQAGSTVMRIGRALQSGPVREDLESQADELYVVVSVAGTDRLGNETTLPWAHLTYTTADLRGARYENLTQWRVLALAQSVNLTSRLSRQAAQEWCMDRARREEGIAFCRRL